MKNPSVIKAVSVGLNPGKVGAPPFASKAKTRASKPVNVSKNAKFAKFLGEALK